MSSKSADGHSLRRRMILAATASSCAIAVVVAVLIVAVSWRYHMGHVHSMVGRLADDLRNEYAELNGATQEFFHHMEVDADEHDMSRTFVILSTPDGQELRATATPERVKARILRAVRQGRLEHRFYTERSSSTDRHVAIRMKSRPLYDGNLITVARDVTGVERYLLFLAITQGAATVLSILLTCLAVTLIVSRFVRRLNSIAAAAESIESGDWSCRVRETQGESREIRTLVRAFNGMCDKNERTLGELRVLTDNIAHDLRTPLTRLSMAAETALFDEAAHDSLADRTLNETRGMIEMINTMLDIAQTGAKIDRSPRADVDVGCLVRDIGELYQPLAEQVGLSIDVNAPEDEVTYSAHHARLQQLIGNLLENAIKYTPSGGRIDVLLERTPCGVTLSVSDTGCGISAEDLPHVFTRFWRADTSRSLPGNGLGLALVQAIAVSYGGSVKCESALGKGSVFTVFLP